LLKDRIARVEEFLDTLSRVAGRERETLQLMARGYTNGEIAAKLTITGRSVRKHVGNVFAKLDLPPSDSGHRRVLAVLAYLG
jgi:DNA-binding CsgD family transcriptional regulator